MANPPTFPLAHPGSSALALFVILGAGCGSSAPSGSSSNAETNGDASGATIDGGAASCIFGGSNAAADAAVAAACYPDHDGINGGDYTIDLLVDDNEFYKMMGTTKVQQVVIGTQNDAQVTLTLTNNGTKPHGFEVGCTNVLPSYPDLPSGCPAVACFPAGATIAPIAAGKSATVVFDTPTPDGLNYPFKSSEASDSTVPGLNCSQSQWTLM
jgi:hypothetical protein